MLHVATNAQPSSTLRLRSNKMPQKLQFTQRRSENNMLPVIQLALPQRRGNCRHLRHVATAYEHMRAQTKTCGRSKRIGEHPDHPRPVFYNGNPSATHSGKQLQVPENRFGMHWCNLLAGVKLRPTPPWLRGKRRTTPAMGRCPQWEALASGDLLLSFAAALRPEDSAGPAAGAGLTANPLELRLNSTLVEGLSLCLTSGDIILHPNVR